MAADTEPQGIVTGSTQGATLAAATAFAGSAPTFTYKHLLAYLTSLSHAYWKAPGKRLVFNLGMVQHLFGLLDDNKRPYFEYGANNILTIPTMIDPGMPDFSAKANKALLYGDLNAQTVRMAGSPRIGYSDVYGWDSDLMSWKATLFGGSSTTAPVALKHHAFTA